MDPDDLDGFDSVLGKAMKRCTCPPNHANLLVQMVAICYNRFTISFVNLRHINRICEAYFRPIIRGRVAEEMFTAFLKRCGESLSGFADTDCTQNWKCTYYTIHAEHSARKGEAICSNISTARPAWHILRRLLQKPLKQHFLCEQSVCVLIEKSIRTGSG